VIPLPLCDCRETMYFVESASNFYYYCYYHYNHRTVVVEEPPLCGYQSIQIAESVIELHPEFVIHLQSSHAPRQWYDTMEGHESVYNPPLLYTRSCDVDDVYDDCRSDCYSRPPQCFFCYCGACCTCLFAVHVK
jgi:hypothetical protein